MQAGLLITALGAGALAGMACGRQGERQSTDDLFSMAPRQPPPHEHGREFWRTPPRVEDGALALDSLEMDFFGVTWQVDLFEVEGHPFIWIEAVNGTNRARFWSLDLPFGNSSSSEAEWVVPREVNYATGMSIGCGWFDDDRPPTESELASWRMEPGARLTWLRGFEPDGWMESDGLYGDDPTPSLRSWSLRRSFVVPRDEPPALLPYDWESIRVTISWSQEEGSAVSFRSE